MYKNVMTQAVELYNSLYIILKTIHPIVTLLTVAHLLVLNYSGSFVSCLRELLSC